MPSTRRDFLKNSMASAAALTLGPSMLRMPGTNVSYSTMPRMAPPGVGSRAVVTEPIVVFVQLFGGNDGLNTVYPLDGKQRQNYEKFRPTLAIGNTSEKLQPYTTAGVGSSAVLDIGANEDGSKYALHPGMEALHGIFNKGKLAVLPGVHYPFANHSHFQSEAIWYTGDPQGVTGLGWFGKYLDFAGFLPTDVPAVMLSNQLNPLFTPTQTSLLAFNDLGGLRFPARREGVLKSDRYLNFCRFAEQMTYPEVSKIGQTGQATINKIRDYFLQGNGLENAGKVEALMVNEDGNYNQNIPLVYSSPLNPEVNPKVEDNGLAIDLKHVAAVIRSNVGARFFHVGIGGFDSHSEQEEDFYHGRLLREVSEAVAAFYNEMDQSVTLPEGYTGYDTSNLSNRVLIVTFSEFGRTIRQNNANATRAGTDHATSAPQLILGGQVQGGQFGAYPQLDDPGEENKDDLKMTTDFRDIFGTILTRWLGVPSSEVGPGPGKMLIATPEADADGKSYTTFAPINFLAP